MASWQLWATHTLELSPRRRFTLTQNLRRDMSRQRRRLDLTMIDKTRNEIDLLKQKKTDENENEFENKTKKLTHRAKKSWIICRHFVLRAAPLQWTWKRAGEMKKKLPTRLRRLDKTVSSCSNFKPLISITQKREKAELFFAIQTHWHGQDKKKFLQTFKPMWSSSRFDLRSC